MNDVHAPWCPRCRVALSAGQARNVTLYGCAQCGGVWLDNACANRMVQAYEADALSMADRAAQCATCGTDTSVRGIPCAACDAPMEVRQVYQVDIDVCPQHGTWFDAHELHKVSDAMAQARRQQFRQGAAGRPGGRPGPRPTRPRPQGAVARGASNDAAFMVGYVAADAVDMGADMGDVGLGVAEMGAGAADTAGDVVGAVADGGVDILGGAFELVGGILGGLLDF